MIVADELNDALGGTPNRAGQALTINTGTGLNADIVGKWFYSAEALPEKAAVQIASGFPNRHPG
jgi:hypothetical protein